MSPCSCELQVVVARIRHLHHIQHYRVARTNSFSPRRHPRATGRSIASLERLLRQIPSGRCLFPLDGSRHPADHRWGRAHRVVWDRP